MALDNDGEIVRSLGRIEGTLTMIQTTTAGFQAIADKLTERVTNLEKWQSYTKGLWAATGAILTWMLTKLVQ